MKKRIKTYAELKEDLVKSMERSGFSEEDIYRINAERFGRHLMVGRVKTDRRNAYLTLPLMED